jgi:hypothetical protein
MPLHPERERLLNAKPGKQIGNAGGPTDGPATLPHHSFCRYRIERLSITIS